MPKTAAARQMRLRALLLNEKRRLWNELRVELFDHLGADLNKQFDIPQDLGDRGMLDVLEDTGLAVANLKTDLLTQMDGALLKLENGSYGICEDCSKEIDEARLLVEPYATCCVGCQQRREFPGKQTAQY